MDVLTKPTVTIRQAQIPDLAVCVEMVLALQQETFWKHMQEKADPLAMTIFILNRLFKDGNFCLYVAEQDGKIVGICGGEIVTHFLAPQAPILTEWAWWVVPEARQGTVGARLWLTVCQWAKERGVKYSSRTRVLSKDRIGKTLGTESFTITEL